MYPGMHCVAAVSGDSRLTTYHNACHRSGFKKEPLLQGPRVQLLCIFVQSLSICDRHVMFVVSQDPRKFARCKDLLSKNEEIKAARKVIFEDFRNPHRVQNFCLVPSGTCGLEPYLRPKAMQNAVLRHLHCRSAEGLASQHSHVTSRACTDPSPLNNLLR